MAVESDVTEMFRKKSSISLGFCVDCFISISCTLMRLKLEIVDDAFI